VAQSLRSFLAALWYNSKTSLGTKVDFKAISDSSPLVSLIVEAYVGLEGRLAISS
jgi:hypothetical protein